LISPCLRGRRARFWERAVVTSAHHHRQRRPDSVVLVGGSGFIGTAVARALVAGGADVTIVDRAAPRVDAAWLPSDLLMDVPELPRGRIVVMAGASNPRPPWPWTLPLDNAVTTARLLPQLGGREVTLVSSVEVYGAADGPLREETPPRLPVTLDELESWCEDASAVARNPCPPWRVAALCRRLADTDAGGRWIYALSKLAQELLVRSVVPPDALTILRLANVFGVGQERIVGRLVRAALAGRPLIVHRDVVRSFVPAEDVGRFVQDGIAQGVFNIGSDPISIEALARYIRAITSAPSRIVLSRPHKESDSCGVVDVGRLRSCGFETTALEVAVKQFLDDIRKRRPPVFEPPLPVVLPPRPQRPDEVADRQQQALWSGSLKGGNRWSSELRERLRETLHLGADRELVLTTSGTAALRQAILAVAGPGQGEVAVLPSFTYPATADVLVELGYRLRFCEVDQDTWTLDPDRLAGLLAIEPARLVVAVDTFGNPCDYELLHRVCGAAGAVLVADSAAALGSIYRGVPVGTQAVAHAFSMSFAKVLSAGGSGGAVAFTRTEDSPDAGGGLRSELMDELHAVAALDQLDVFPRLLARRRSVAARYRARLASSPWLTPQRTTAACRHSYVHWVARVDPAIGRDRLKHELETLGVCTREYFKALHLHTYRTLARLQISEELDKEVLALPISSELTDDDAELVALAVAEAGERLHASNGPRRARRQPVALRR
jgi:dTDP-4-amino-4,6-dideoxygalactose transaminase/nucleoside-diphosphate-sugar epimerase